MAKYTVELRDVVKSGVDVFNFPYPFYDETKRKDFEARFIDHFYFREIGVETVGRFQHNLKVKCNERLPFYNELVKLTLLQYDVLKPYNLTEELERTNTNNRTATAESSQTGTTTGTSTSNAEAEENKDTTTTANNKRVGSDTPNGLLSMTDIKGNVYASKAEIEDNQDTATDKTTQTNTTTATNNDEVVSNGNSSQNESNTAEETYTLTKKGHIGVQTASELLLKHIELLEKVQTFYTQFFDECEDLFMQIY